MKDEAFAKVVEAYLRTDDLQPNRLNHWIDLKLVDCSREEQWIEYEFEPEEWCLNPSGGVHGGIISSVFDIATGMGGVAFTKQGVTTTDLSISFLRPMIGEKFLFHIDYTSIGKTMVRGNGRAIDPKTGKVLATALITFVIIGPWNNLLQV